MYRNDVKATSLVFTQFCTISEHFWKLLKTWLYSGIHNMLYTVCVHLKILTEAHESGPDHLLARGKIAWLSATPAVSFCCPGKFHSRAEKMEFMLKQRLN